MKLFKFEQNISDGKVKEIEFSSKGKTKIFTQLFSESKFTELSFKHIVYNYAPTDLDNTFLIKGLNCGVVVTVTNEKICYLTDFRKIIDEQRMCIRDNLMSVIYEKIFSDNVFESVKNALLKTDYFMKFFYNWRDTVEFLERHLPSIKSIIDKQFRGSQYYHDLVDFVHDKKWNHYTDNEKSKMIFDFLNAQKYLNNERIYLVQNKLYLGDDDYIIKYRLWREYLHREQTEQTEQTKE